MNTLIWMVMTILVTGAAGAQVRAQDGRVYKTVRIGAQNWMAENLNVSTYRNGDTIPQVQDAKTWSNLKTGAWCYYGSSPETGSKYGKLYNWYAVTDPRGLAPEGWHIPSDAEWNTLTSAIGGPLGSSSKIKATEGWTRNGNGANETGFSALPGGTRTIQSFSFLGNYGYWWTSTEYDSYSAWNRYLGYNYPDIGRSTGWKAFGSSVRCVKDEILADVKNASSQEDSSTNVASQVDQKPGPEAIAVGSQTWTTQNLDVSVFGNGDEIVEAKTDSQWVRAGRSHQPAWCYYDNDSTTGAKYGKLYNWYAITDKRGLAPPGWHIPVGPEWSKLIAEFGGELSAGTKVKSDESFKGLFAGFRDSDGQFHNVDIVGYWWGATETSPGTAQSYSVNYFSEILNTNATADKRKGFSVRCVKD